MGRVLGLCGPCHVDVVRTWAALSQSSKALRGLMLTASQDVKELEISDSWITMESMDGVATTFTGLTSVKLVSTFSSFGNTDAGLQHVAKLTNLTTLDLTGCFFGITDAELQHVAKLTNLTTLSLSSHRITDAGLQYVAKLTNLTTLSLSSHSITDAGLQHVAKLTNLATLSLSSHSITNAGLRHVTKLTSLNKLVLNDCYRIPILSAGYQPVL